MSSAILGPIASLRLIPPFAFPFPLERRYTFFPIIGLFIFIQANPTRLLHLTRPFNFLRFHLVRSPSNLIEPTRRSLCKPLRVERTHFGPLPFIPLHGHANTLLLSNTIVRSTFALPYPT